MGGAKNMRARRNRKLAAVRWAKKSNQAWYNRVAAKAISIDRVTMKKAKKSGCGNEGVSCI